MRQTERTVRCLPMQQNSEAGASINWSAGLMRKLTTPEQFAPFVEQLRETLLRQIRLLIRMHALLFRQFIHTQFPFQIKQLTGNKNYPSNFRQLGQYCT